MTQDVCMCDCLYWVVVVGIKEGNMKRMKEEEMMEVQERWRWSGDEGAGEGLSDHQAQAKQQQCIILKTNCLLSLAVSMVYLDNFILPTVTHQYRVHHLITICHLTPCSSPMHTHLSFHGGHPSSVQHKCHTFYTSFLPPPPPFP